METEKKYRYPTYKEIILEHKLLFFIMFFGVFFLWGYPHEYSHALACMLIDGDPTGITMSHMYCPNMGDFSNLFFVRIAPTISVIAIMVLFLVFHNRMGKLTGLRGIYYGLQVTVIPDFMNGAGHIVAYGNNAFGAHGDYAVMFAMLSPFREWTFLVFVVNIILFAVLVIWDYKELRAKPKEPNAADADWKPLGADAVC